MFVLSSRGGEHLFLDFVTFRLSHKKDPELCEKAQSREYSSEYIPTSTGSPIAPRAAGAMRPLTICNTDRGQTGTTQNVPHIAFKHTPHVHGSHNERR